MPKTPVELVDHNCLLYRGLTESTRWPFVGPEGRFSVSVPGNLTSTVSKRSGLVFQPVWESACLPRYLLPMISAIRMSSPFSTNL